MSRIPIALGLYSVYKELQRDLESTLRRVKDIGYEGVEFYGEFKHDPAKINDLLQSIGLVNCGWHTEWKLLQEDTIAATLQYHKLAGTRNIIIPALGGPWQIGHTESEESPDMWVKHARQMNAISERIREQNFRLGYHTHAYEFDTNYDGASPWNILCEYTNEDIILEPDTGNCIEGGADPAKVIGKIPGRPLLVHCKPFSHIVGHETFIGDAHDENNWAAILEECRRAGTQWLVVEHESDIQYAQFEGARLCFEGLQKKLEAI